MASPSLTSASHFIDKIKTNSIINPLLWLSMPVLSVFGLGFFLSNGWKSILCIIICMSWITYIAVAYGYFALTDPERLHSEEHQREIKRMDIEASKSGKSISYIPTIDHTTLLPNNIDEIPDDDKSNLTIGED